MALPPKKVPDPWSSGKTSVPAMGRHEFDSHWGAQKFLRSKLENKFFMIHISKLTNIYT